MAIAQRPSQGIIQKQPMSAHSSIMVPLAIAKLQRKISLNPRVMTPPGLEVLSNKAMVAIRQQMEMDIKGTPGWGCTTLSSIWVRVSNKRIYIFRPCAVNRGFNACL
ncbi:hypothetical protein DPMN_141451 [Dreissena polymorpha]|uniref:Uncharacterized protein n=1 Tax=Dreissena polymorpha TaxID=45954 RepID=A0A9D4JIB0_DREPO|nr:hypothetical protein DPMN_141451 [Dreissena polymorpha]